MTDTVFSHMGLSCVNPGCVEKFYTKYFGFKRTKVFYAGSEEIVMIKSGNVYLELFKSTEVSSNPPSAGAGPKYPGWRHICFSVDNLDLKLKEMGSDAKITLGPIDMSSSVPGMKVCWLSDPEGNIVELNEGYSDDEK